MNAPRFAERPEDLPDAAVFARLTGMEMLQAMLSGEVALPAACRAMGYWLHSAEPGRVAFRGVPGFDFTNPMGTVHGGWYGTLLDSALGCAVMSAMARGQMYTTLEYRVNILRPIPIGTEVEALAELDHAGRSTGVAHGRLTGVADGRLYATGSTTCLVLAPGG